MERSEYEKVRRGDWRCQVERISRLFRASGENRWTRDVLSLGEMLFRINGWDCYLPNLSSRHIPLVLSSSLPPRFRPGP